MSPELEPGPTDCDRTFVDPPSAQAGHPPATRRCQNRDMDSDDDQIELTIQVACRQLGWTAG